MGSVLVTPFFQRQKVGTWRETNVLTLAVAKVANLGGKIARAPNRRGKIGDESPRSLGPNRGGGPHGPTGVQTR